MSFINIFVHRNLHDAVIEYNIEKAFCIVEFHWSCHGEISDINIRDSFNKTVLDLSKERGLHLLADYFEENKASESSKIYAPSEKVPDV
ncbi:hypothetical protein CEXT_484881 [Caerostris extrusa]|uniref:Uncharacterized protein n=1 Tax=Caerostris extrusa TaxID=172846 RepID=A0AAV4MLM7_CAEEX|nr:hypothetical protein CEXT_484881 [Caerostris extrusa]